MIRYITLIALLMLGQSIAQAQVKTKQTKVVRSQRQTVKRAKKVAKTPLKPATPVQPVAPAKEQIIAEDGSNRNDRTQTVSAAAAPVAGSDDFQLFKFQKGDEKCYRLSTGLRVLWGIALTGKYFIKDQHAIEGVLRYRGYQDVGSDLSVAATYQYHKSIPRVSGLRIYGGGGPFAGYFSFKDRIAREMELAGYDNGLYIGVSAVIGAEYKFGDLPLAISLDWQPSVILIDSYSGSGFGGENGGLGIKYTF